MPQSAQLPNESAAFLRAGRSSRRAFLAWSGRVAAGSALAGTAIPHIHAGEDNTIRLALIGCGHRGCGAAVNAFEAPGGPVKLVAMADLFENRLKASHATLSNDICWPCGGTSGTAVFLV